MFIFLLIVIIIALVLEWLSLRNPLGQVSYRLEPSKRSVEPGEEFLLRTVIENASPYHVPYLYVEEDLPSVVQIEQDRQLKFESFGKVVRLKNTMFIRKHQRVRRNMPAVIYKRGICYFKKANLIVGDFLGLVEKEKQVEQNRSVVVYPGRLEDERLTQVLSDIMGNISVRSFLHEDPILVMSYRDYTGREPLRSISFPMTAKRNQLTVKEFDHTREEMVDIIFDVSYKGEFERHFDQMEAMFCVVRTLCEYFENRGVCYRLITNAYYATVDVHGVNVLQSGGSGGREFLKIMEILGMSSGSSMCKTEELLQTALQGFSGEKELVYVSQRREPETAAIVKSMERSYGAELHCIYGEDYEELYREECRKREEKTR